MEERQMDRMREASATGARRLKDSAQDVAERASAYVQARMGDVSERAQGLAQDANARVAELTGKPVESWASDMRGYIREHPLQAVAIAIGLGYVFGKLMTSRA